jgi:ERCC4-related helicase
LVIRFGGEPSLIQLVQSKGRARHNGRLVQICTTEEQEHYARLQRQEACVKAVYADVAEINCDAKKRKLLDHSGENEEKRANRGDYV